MNITITKNIKAVNAITHGGIFHADDVFATVILALSLAALGLKGVALSIARVFRVDSDINENDITVYDIGGGRYDHHQKGGNGYHDDGTPYAACGLLWRDLGRYLCSCPEVERMVEDSLIKGIDAVDNGVANRGDCMSVSAAISAFNPTWDSEESADEAFLRACDFAEVILRNAIKGAESKVKAKEDVEWAMLNARDGVMVLDHFVPWQEYLLADERGNDINFVVFPSLRGGWNWQGVPAELGSFQLRKPIPEAWKGASQEAITNLIGIKDCTFVHPNGFLGSTSTELSAIRMASYANNGYKEPTEDEDPITVGDFLKLVGC